MRSARLLRPAGVLIPALAFTLCLLGPGRPVAAQEATPTIAVTVVTATPAPTATITPTPSITPSPTPTFTALEARLALARAYLDGGDYAAAMEIYSAVALESPGNPTALAGLNEALAAQGGATATAAAPLPTLAPPTPTPVPPTTFSQNFNHWWRLLGSIALAAALIFALLFALLRLLRWFFAWLREFWLMRLRPRFGMDPVAPGIALGEFTEALAVPGYVDSEIVMQTIEESLVRWNRAVPAGLQTPVLLRPLDMVGLGQLSALWARVSTPPRGYLASGLLLGDEAGPYRLAVERIDLRTHRVDASRTFESLGATSADAFHALAMTAALWLRDPLGMEATPETLAGASADAAPTPPQIAFAALDILTPVRLQVDAESVDYPAAPQALDAAQVLVNRLPAGSSLRRDLQAAVDDLRASVQPGRA